MAASPRLNQSDAGCAMQGGDLSSSYIVYYCKHGVCCTLPYSLRCLCSTCCRSLSGSLASPHVRFCGCAGSLSPSDPARGTSSRRRTRCAGSCRLFGCRNPPSDLVHRTLNIGFSPLSLLSIPIACLAVGFSAHAAPLTVTTAARDSQPPAL